jgi:damage-control phosphatase, subfamily I
MKTAWECIPCFVRQAFEAAEMSIGHGPQRDALMRRLLHEIADSDWSVMPVTVAQRIHRTVREVSGVADPYRELKTRMNKTALGLLPALSEAMRHQPDSQEAVVRLAVAGNLLDAGSKNRLEPHELEAHLETIWHLPLAGSASELFTAAEKAERILYLADNAGEIVFDRMLIEALQPGKTTVAVRGAPVINDATLEDAEKAGISAIAPVTTNGVDVPGTLLSECSEDFRRHFEQADLIISKGQGNYETLARSEQNIFFLLTVKCPVISEDIGVPVGTMVCKQQR